MSNAVRLLRLGLTRFEDAQRRQEGEAQAVRAGADEALLLMELRPVYSLGRSARPEDLLLSPAELARRGAAIVETDRGGGVTFHGPGQLVCYPILDLRRRGLGPVDYVRSLEETLIAALAACGIASGRVAGRPGVWAGGAKVASIGVRVRGGVTTHGFSLNVENDLHWFDAIVPCGLIGARVTSVARLLNTGRRADGQNRRLSVASLADPVASAFAARFGADLVEAILPDRPIAPLPAAAEVGVASP
jgi:lipoate-protein ligase B